MSNQLKGKYTIHILLLLNINFLRCYSAQFDSDGFEMTHQPQQIHMTRYYLWILQMK